MLTPPAVVDVCANCAVTTLHAAVEAAKPGTLIRVRDRQLGDIVVRVPNLSIVGDGGEISAEGRGGTGIDVRAPGFTLRDITLRGFGTDDGSGRHAAIVIESKGTTVDHVTFLDNAFAISAVQASDGTISASRLESSDKSGDPIRFFHSRDMRILGSTIDGGRDVFMDWSPNVVVRDTLFTHLRYGLHNMFSPNMMVDRDAFVQCEIGTNFMYAERLQVTNSRFVGNVGPAGYGIGLEDTDAGVFTGNLFVANHAGMHIVDSPFDELSTLSIKDNLFSANGSGLVVQSDAHAIVVLGNSFVNNTEQVEVSGGGAADGIVWTSPDGGNYWSDYAGYARNGSEIGALAYRPNSTFESVLDSNPDLQLFRESAAADAIDFATRALAVQPEPKLVDGNPLVRAPSRSYAAGAPEPVEPSARGSNGELASIAALPLITLLASATLPLFNRRRESIIVRSPKPLAVQLTNVTKLYAKNRGIRNVSLAVAQGEVVALWGANGAGKTTLLRCILAHSDRRSVGYAPQHLPDFEMPIARLVPLLAALHEADAGAVRALFDEFGLDPDDTRYVGELSGGLRQRLGVACAMIGDPPVLVLDEPTAGLDYRSRLELLEELSKLKARGKTIILTTHLLKDIYALADRVVVMKDGKIVAESSGRDFEEAAS